MSTQVFNIQYPSSLKEIVEVNPSFDRGVIRIAYPGENRNRTCIDKEVFEKCLNSLVYCPVVANYEIENDEVGGHDIELKKGQDGKLLMVNATHPIGIVPRESQFRWESVDDGTEMREYLTADVLLWKRQPIYQYLKDHDVVSQSMEIDVNSYEFIDGIYHIHDFTFTALCLLGEDIEPCFEDAALTTFSLSEMKAEYAAMMDEVQNLYANDPDALLALGHQNHTIEEVNHLDAKEELVVQFGFSAEELDFSIEDMSIEELTIKLEDLKCSQKEQFTLTLTAQLEEVERLVHQHETYVDLWGDERSRYSLMDIQDQEAIVRDYKEDWLCYGVPITTAGDAMVLEWEGKKRKKIVYVDFDEGEDTGAFIDRFSSLVQEMDQNHLSVLEEANNQVYELQAANEELKGQFEAMSEQYSALQSQMYEKTHAEKIESAQALLQQFESQLAGIERFEALKAAFEGMSDEELDGIENECYMLLGKREFAKHGTPQKDSLTKLNLEQHDPLKQKEEPYGGLYSKYGH